MRVLVVEDDARLRSVVRRSLDENGYVVDDVATAEEALVHLRAYEYEVAVVDWRLPAMSGVDLVSAVRDRAIQVPILLLTARDAPGDRIAGLDSGADDYLVKPFDIGELLARLRALQRRPRTVRQPLSRMGRLSFDEGSLEVLVDGSPVALTTIETSILQLMLTRAPAVVRRRSIAMHVWEKEEDAVGSNTIDVHIARLRAKLARSGVRIETVRGIGYRIAEDDRR